MDKKSLTFEEAVAPLDTNKMVDKVIKQYHFIDPGVELIRHNENMTYKVTDIEKSYVLRIHKPYEGINLDLLYQGKERYDKNHWSSQ